MRQFLAVAVIVAMFAAVPPLAAQEPAVETTTLPNGLTVILHPDHSLPQVTINTWFWVGAKDEAPGRTGFAHLFEHLMFMGTDRVPGNQFDMLMESGGGANNASTSSDRTNYYSWGPSSLLPTLLWLDADRLEGLAKAMTTEKLDLQRSVVRNERRQSYENRPYGAAGLVIPEALYPPGHPYHHPVIGSHEDLQAATLEDVKSFFTTFYVPANASLVVAGDFEPEQAKKLVMQTFGAVPVAPMPVHATAPPVVLEREVRRLVTDKVNYPRLILVWPAPPAYRDGDAAMDLIAAILADGESGRLYERLVLDDRLAQDVQVLNDSSELSSEFSIEVTAAEGVDLERIKRAVVEELERFKTDGPSEAEVTRVKAASEASFLRRKENLRARADMLNAFYRTYGRPDSFARELARRLGPTGADLQQWARRVLGEGRVDLRIVPQGEVAAAALDTRPADLPEGVARPVEIRSLTLANGIPLHVVSRPGSGLFTGTLLVDGGERLVPAGKAGLAALTATLLTKGAGGRDATAFADAVASLGASVEAEGSWHDVSVSVSGLASRLGPTLDLFADAVVRPTLAEADFAREKDLALAAIRARTDEPNAVAGLVSRVLLYGRDDPRGRPGRGYADTVGSLERRDVTDWLPRLVNPANAALVFAGDVAPEALKAALDARLGAWNVKAEKAAALPAPLARLAGGGRLVLVHRPQAPQSVLAMIRPVAAGDETVRTVRDTLSTLFGGTFTSRLMQNIREKHGYSYGARSGIADDGNGLLLTARSSVQTAVTGAALAEFKKEFDSLASGNVTPEELGKAVRTVRFEAENLGATTASLAAALAELAAAGQPLDLPRRQLAVLPSITLEKVNAEARSGLYDWGSLLVVVVGDKEAVLGQLVAAGFPKPEIVDAEGRPLAP
jgi:predicted Zn-dependent peptidase